MSIIMMSVLIIAAAVVAVGVVSIIRNRRLGNSRVVKKNKVKGSNRRRRSRRYLLIGLAFGLMGAGEPRCKGKDIAEDVRGPQPMPHVNPGARCHEQPRTPLYCCLYDAFDNVRGHGVCLGPWQCVDTLATCVNGRQFARVWTQHEVETTAAYVEQTRQRLWCEATDGGGVGCPQDAGVEVWDGARPEGIRVEPNHLH